METLTVHNAEDYSSITTLSNYLGKNIILTQDDGERTYTGTLELAALEASSTSYVEASTLSLFFRGMINPITFIFNLGDDNPTILKVEFV